MKPPSERFVTCRACVQDLGGVRSLKDRLSADTMTKQYLELRQKHFEFFMTGLKSDWEKINSVRGALVSVDAIAHVKKVTDEADVSLP